MPWLSIRTTGKAAIANQLVTSRATSWLSIERRTNAVPPPDTATSWAQNRNATGPTRASVTRPT